MQSPPPHGSSPVAHAEEIHSIFTSSVTCLREQEAASAAASRDHTILSSPPGSSTSSVVSESEAAALEKSGSLENGLAHVFIQSACAFMERLCQDTQRRMRACDGKLEVLAKGIFLPADYARCLAETRQTKRQEWMVKHGAYDNGLLPGSLFDLREVAIAHDPCNDLRSVETDAVFMLKPGHSASDALDVICDHLGLLFSGDACLLSYYVALREVFGKSKFDALFSADSRHRSLKIGGPIKVNPILCLLNSVSAKEHVIDSFQKGDLVVVDNAKVAKLPPDYQQHVALCQNSSSKQGSLFSCLGMGSGCTYAEMLNHLSRQCRWTTFSDLVILKYPREHKKSSVSPQIVKKCLGEVEICSRDTVLEEEYKIRRSKGLYWVSSATYERCARVAGKALERLLEQEASKEHSSFTSQSIVAGGAGIRGLYRLNEERIACLAKASNEQAVEYLENWMKEQLGVVTSVT